MSRKVNFVGEIDRTKESWKLAVRVTNVWCSENYMDVIFMDEKGGKIHASLNESDLRKLNVVIEEDVIGEFIDIQQHIDESIPKKLVVVMKDQSGHTISWTLWEEYASRVLSFLGTHEGGSIIMLLSLALIKEAKGNFPVTVQNTKVHSRLYITEDIDEINKFKSRCGKLNSERVPRFRLEVKVSDKNVHSKFIIWDKHCVQLLNQSALDLKKQMIQEEGVFDPMELPGPIDYILGKVLAFKIKIQLKYKGYSVHQISEDPQIIESIVGSIKNFEGAGKNDKGKAICSGANEVDYMDSQSLSATSEFDPASLECLTPAKRISL